MADSRHASGEVTVAPSSTPSSLLAGLRAIDPQAWRRLAELYAPLVYRWCRSQGLQASDAEDVVQEVFLVVHQRVRDFRRERPEDSFRGWLWGITRNKLGDWFRRSARRGTDLGLAAERIPAEDPPVPAAGSGLYRRAVDQVRDEFESTTWQAFWAVAIEGRDPNLVADELGKSVNAVYLARSRIQRRLREVLGEQE